MVRDVWLSIYPFFALFSVSLNGALRNKKIFMCCPER
jgi:hypothetical protein